MSDVGTSAGQATAAGAIALGVGAVGVALALGASASGVVVDVVFLLLGAIGAGLGRLRPRALPFIVAAGIVGLALPLAFHGGTRGVFTGLGVVGAVATGLWWSRREAPAPLPATTTGPHGWHGVGLAAVAFVVYGLYAVERHRRFGSGAWDYGCYVHNAWLFAHGDAFSLTARSAVLGDAAFWGGTNHFMPSLVLTAPLAWWMEWTGNTAWLAVAQNAVVVAAAVPLALLARRRGLHPVVSAAIVVAWLFHVGTQAALLFDVHEIAPVPLLLFTALLIVDEPPSARRVSALTVVLLVWAFTKESSWLGVASFGLFLLALQPGWRRVGAGVVVVSVTGFVVIVGIIQPGLLEEGSRGMIHAARFRGVGEAPAGSLKDAALSLLLHPGRAIAAVVWPLEKLQTLLTSTSGFGHAPLASPAALLIGGANVAERFLADKREMWGLAFHYGLVTAAWLAVGAVDVTARLRRTPFAAAGIVMAGVGVSFMTAARTPDLRHLEQPYFASADEVARYRRALALIDADDAVVAQNHFLPHLALRRHIWLPEERFIARADVVVLDTAASPWPHDARHVRRLVVRLQRDAAFEVVFNEETTLVFRRRAVTPAT
jgi:uncharacterized membrane protein